MQKDMNKTLKDTDHRGIVETPHSDLTTIQKMQKQKVLKKILKDTKLR